MGKHFFIFHCSKVVVVGSCLFMEIYHHSLIPRLADSTSCNCSAVTPSSTTNKVIIAAAAGGSCCCCPCCCRKQLHTTNKKIASRVVVIIVSSTSPHTSLKWQHCLVAAPTQTTFSPKGTTIQQVPVLFIVLLSSC